MDQNKVETKGIDVMITGATGMVGEGVLHECINDPRIASITLLGRRSACIFHPKVKEVLLDDLFAFTGKESGVGSFDACFYCLGATSIGKTEQEYMELTHDLTLKIARPLLALNPKITFCYVAALGTDQTEKGKTMWARVKGKTENDLAGMGFEHFFAFRPFMLTPTKGLQHTHKFYSYISWLFPLGRVIYPKGFCTLKELAQAMIKVGSQDYGKKIITVPDMVMLAR